MPPYPISPMTSTSLAARCPGTPPHPQRSAGQWGQPHPVAVRFGVRLYLRNVLCGYALAIAAMRWAKRDCLTCILSRLLIRGSGTLPKTNDSYVSLI